LRSFLRAVIACVVAISAIAIAARAELPAWMQSIVSGSAIEAALFRAMDIPSTSTLYPRPPAEARTQVDSLVAAKPNDAELYALRARVEEQALDFTSAERDWQAFVARSADGAAKTSAEYALADYYHRRNEGQREIAALEVAASAPTTTGESFLPADQQTAWKAFPRAIEVAHQQGFGDEATLAIHRTWIVRYPHETAARAALLKALLSMRRFDEAQRTIDDYRTAFPGDSVFPIKAEALVAFDQGTPQATEHALALFDQAFQPIWDPALVQTYIELLSATHTQHAAIAEARNRLAQNPDDLRSTAFLFDVFAQQGRFDVATNTLAQYAVSKEQRHAAWTPDELNSFATLLERAQQPADAARFHYALAATPGKLANTAQTPEEAGLCGLIHLLLTDADAPIALGSGNLSIFRDIATTDQGPGYLNGILSLWLNSADPATEFRDEEARATPYFHHAKAAELLAVLDQRFPASGERAALHATFIRQMLSYGNDDAVLQAGKQFLADFPNSPDRLEIAFDLADIDARRNDTRGEFALYDMLLAERSAKLNGLPLTAAGVTSSATAAENPSPDLDANATDNSGTPASQPSAATLLAQSLDVSVNPPATFAIGQQYRSVLDRYLSRLVVTGQLPAALALLRRELDRNPNDPLLYERLADFLQQNNLGAQQEAVYQEAIARFQSANFYDKLARFYLRRRQQHDFDALTRKVVDTFRGTELQTYFGNVSSAWPEEFLQLNLYAHKRFPHDLVFTRNLLIAYRARGTANPAAYELLLRQHWQEASDLQSEFFEFLSHNGKMQDELAALQSLLPTSALAVQNPAAARELAELNLWQSHFEAAAPLLGGLADQYPADATVGDTAVSVFRSLAYFGPPQAQRAAAIAQHLADGDPASLDRLATIGDIFADSTDPSLNLSVARQLAQAAPFWRRMHEVHPGLPDGYLQSATVFWDYFQFDDALTEITAARQRFRSPALFAYQAGAIHENQRDETHAIAEYVAAFTAPPGEADTGAADARARLLTLAKRPATASLVDRATAQAVDTNPTLESLTLRAEVLSAEGKSSDVSALIAKAIDRATTTDELAALANFAADHSLPEARDAALTRQIAFTNDPVERIELQYQLVRVYTDQHNAAASEQLIDAVYAANPRVIGVVRSTVDFDWSNHREARAISVLLEAAQAANPELAHDFTLEAVDKSNRSGDYAGARRLLQPLLATDPFNALYLNLQAQSYSLAHDDAGVRDLYTQTITALKASSLSAADKRAKIALARQGLIPALTGLKDYAGGMDQHIALLSAFPEDEPTLENAIAYARMHQRESQLVTFLQQTAAASPRDSRFYVDLARVDAAFEDNTGALVAYSKAIAIRSDRPDLYIARAELEERAQNFDAACGDYDRIFTLTYRDPQWMQKAALARARQGRPELAVKALETAYLDGTTPTPQDYFTVAQQLAQWNFLAQADPFAAKGVALAGDDLATKPSLNADANFYATLLARERKAAAAIAFFARLRDQAAAASASSPAVVRQQIAEQGLAAVTDAEWRHHLLEARRNQAVITFASAVRSIASTAAELYTPEEQDTFAKLLDSQRVNRPLDEVVSVWIPAASAANLKDREAAWRRDVLLHGGVLADGQLQPYDRLERARMDFTPLAETLDAYAAQLRPVAQSQVLAMAVTAWQSAGNVERETAGLRMLVVRRGAIAYEQRLFEIYLRSNSPALLALAADSNAELADSAANFVLAHDDERLTVQALAGFQHRPAVWHSATRALVGLYFNDDSAGTDSAFSATLVSLNIGDQLGGPPDSRQHLVGEQWFAYSTRYGLFLALAQQPARPSEDFMPALIEQAPTDSASYTALADTYRGAHNLAAALAEYRHALELDPAEPGPEVSIAEAQYEAGHRDEALAAYRDAFSMLRTLVDTHKVPETFWATFGRIAADAHAHRLGAELQPAMDNVLGAYIRKNRTYRTDELFQSAWTSLGLDDPARATEWLLTLTNVGSPDDRSSLVESVADLPIPNAQREPVFRARLELARAAFNSTPEMQREFEQQALDNAISNYAEWLLDRQRTADAAALLGAVASSERRKDQFIRLDLLLAVLQSRLTAVLNSFSVDPDNAPSLSILSSVANSLRLRHDGADSRALLEFVFARKVALQQLEDSDYLALAQARLDTHDLSGALDVLRRFTQRGDFYSNLDTAASLLERTHHAAESLMFLRPLAHGNPWDARAQLRLAAAELSAHQPNAPATLTSTAFDAQSPYATRALAALALHTAGSSGHFDSTELTQLASSTPTAQPRFVYASLVAAQSAAPAQAVPLLRIALLVAPDPLSDIIRLRIFHAEVSLTHFEAAHVAIEPVLDTHAYLRSAMSPGPDDGDVSDVGAEADTPRAESLVAPNSLDPFTLEAALPDEASHRAFLLELADVEQRRGEDASALEYLRAALDTHPPDAAANQLRARIHTLQATLNLAAENMQRRPVIQSSVVQTVVVRPRLSALPEVHP
jgi:cellulose synthase operon protein C